MSLLYRIAGIHWAWWGALNAVLFSLGLSYIHGWWP